MKRTMQLLGRVVFWGLVVALMAGTCIIAQSEAAKSMPPSAGQAVVEEYFSSVLSKADAAAAEAILAPGFQRTDRSQAGATLGAAGVMFLANYQLSAFADLHYTIDDLVVEGDHVAVCWTATGTQSGEYGAVAANGKPVKWTGMSFFQLQNGKIAAEEANFEELSEVLAAEDLRISPSYAE